MISIAHLLLWAAILGVGAGFVAFAVAATFGREWASRAGLAALSGGLLALTSGLLLRWIATGHGPYLGRYEALASYAWVLLVVYLLAQWRFPQARPAGLLAAPVALLLLGAGVLSPSAPLYPTPAMRSLWLWLHVGMAKVALGSLVVSAGVSWLHLRRARASVVAVAAGSAMTSVVDPRERLEELSQRLVSLGFLVLAVVLGTGALWANTAWGAYWNWDPIETWALGTWLAYGIVLHLGRFGGFAGTRWARLNLGALVFSAALFLVLRLLALSPHWIYLGP